MKFDVIIGNPPYQKRDGGAAASAIPLYNLFIEQAIKLSPRYISMIVPARWYSGGRGLDEFRKNMIESDQISELHDFLDSFECFPALGHRGIKGGVCYFLWDKNYKGDTRFVMHEKGNVVSDIFRKLKEDNSDVLIRYNKAIPILRKIKALSEGTFDSLASTRMPFGLTKNYHGMAKDSLNTVCIYAYKRNEYAPRKDITRNLDAVDKYKLIIPAIIGSGDGKTDKIKPVYCAPGFACSDTYLLVGPFGSKSECDNVISYIATMFFHFLVSLQKNTQQAARKVYSFVPVQDFSESWTDEKLYKKYGLTDDEISLIESMIRPMKLK